jgi:hypothetical protein
MKEASSSGLRGLRRGRVVFGVGGREALGEDDRLREGFGVEVAIDEQLAEGHLLFERDRLERYLVEVRVEATRSAGREARIVGDEPTEIFERLSLLSEVGRGTQLGPEGEFEDPRVVHAPDRVLLVGRDDDGEHVAEETRERVESLVAARARGVAHDGLVHCVRVGGVELGVEIDVAREKVVAEERARDRVGPGAVRVGGGALVAHVEPRVGEDPGVAAAVDVGALAPAFRTVVLEVPDPSGDAVGHRVRGGDDLGVGSVLGDHRLDESERRFHDRRVDRHRVFFDEPALRDEARGVEDPVGPQVEALRVEVAHRVPELGRLEVGVDDGLELRRIGGDLFELLDGGPRPAEGDGGADEVIGRGQEDGLRLGRGVVVVRRVGAPEGEGEGEAEGEGAAHVEGHRNRSAKSRAPGLPPLPACLQTSLRDRARARARARARFGERIREDGRTSCRRRIGGQPAPLRPNGSLGVRTAWPLQTPRTGSPRRDDARSAGLSLSLALPSSPGSCPCPCPCPCPILGNSGLKTRHG